MPLLKKINTKNYTIGIWKVKKSECEQFTDNHIYPNYHPELIKYKNSNRKLQVQAVKLLFKELCNKNELISKNGIPYFKEGGSGKLLIPSALAYGPNGTTGIPPHSVLIFEIELIEVIE